MLAILAILPALLVVAALGALVLGTGCTLDRMGSAPLEEEPTGGSGGSGGSSSSSSSTGGVGGEGGSGGTGNTGGTGGTGGGGPIAPTATVYMAAPCLNPSSMSVASFVVPRLYLTCGDQLYQSPQLGTGGSFTSVGQVPSGQVARNHLYLDDSDKYCAVIHHNPIDLTIEQGFTIFDVTTGQPVSGGNVDYTVIDPPDLTYSIIKDTINTPTGAILVAGATICVATSNVDKNDPAVFEAGSVICMPYNSDGTVTISGTTAVGTGRNPTGLTLLNDGQMAIMCSNTSADNPSTSAILDMCGVPIGPCSGVSFGHVHAATIPDIAQTSNGTLLLYGIQKPDAAKGVGTVDWQNNSETFLTNLNIQGAISSMHTAKPTTDELALVGSSGITSIIDGRIFIYNLDGNSWSGCLETALPGLAGPAARYGTDLYVAVDDGNVYKMDLSGL